MTHTYMEHNNGSFITGIWEPKYADGSGSRGLVWRPIKTFTGPTAEINAAKYASFLNGGDHPNKPWHGDAR